jgi:hypothetical protein
MRVAKYLVILATCEKTAIEKAPFKNLLFFAVHLPQVC